MVALHTLPPRSEQPTDLALIAGWRAGDLDAGHRLFARHFATVYRFFETKCPSEADELVQSTFLACVVAKDQYRGEASFKTYLLTLARHQLYRALEARRKDGARLDFAVSSVAELAPTPRTKLAGREDRSRLARALRELPVDTQLLLELHYWEDVEIRELAAIFAAPEGTIRSRLCRARTALRELLRRDPEPTAAAETLESLDRWARTLAPLAPS